MDKGTEFFVAIACCIYIRKEYGVMGLVVALAAFVAVRMLLEAVH